MELYLRVIKENYANFNGRARRQEYWMFYLFNMIFMVGCMVVDGILASMEIPGPFTAIYALGTMIPSLAAGVRRMHDIGKSGWMLLVALIPFIGGIWQIVLLATEGEHGENQYGPDPKTANSGYADAEGDILDNGVLK